MHRPSLSPSLRATGQLKTACTPGPLHLSPSPTASAPGFAEAKGTGRINKKLNLL